MTHPMTPARRAQVERIAEAFYDNNQGYTSRLLWELLLEIDRLSNGADKQ